MLRDNNEKRNSALEVWVYEGSAQGVEFRAEIRSDAPSKTSIWGSAKNIAQAFDMSAPSVSEQISNYRKRFADRANQDIRKFRITASDGKSYEVEHFNMKVINFIANRAQQTDKIDDFLEWAGEMLDKAASQPQVARPMTPSELILMQAQRLVDMEHKQAEHDARIEALENARTDDRLALGDGAERYYSVLGYANVNGYPAMDSYTAARLGKKASSLCRKLGIDYRTLPDPRFGFVNIYPASVLAEVFSV